MPRVWKQRREYKPGETLYARRRLVFSGVVIERHSAIPAHLIRSAVKHKRLWRSGQAGHEPRQVYVRKPYGVISPAPTALPAASVQPGFVPGGVVDVAQPATDSKVVSFKAATGELVTFAQPPVTDPPTPPPVRRPHRSGR